MPIVALQIVEVSLCVQNAYQWNKGINSSNKSRLLWKPGNKLTVVIMSLLCSHHIK
jgi:hypothetical protein